MTSIDYLTFLLGYFPVAIFSQAFAFLSATLNAEEIKLSQSSQATGGQKDIWKTWSQRICLYGTRSSYGEKPHGAKMATPDDAGS